MADLVVTKLDAARRQLVTAVRLYFKQEDDISIHTLGSASRNVLANICGHKGIEVGLLREQMLRGLIKPEHHKAVNDKFRESENFFKHADRDPDGQLTFNPETTEFTLLEAVEAYQTITGDRIPELHVYRVWWILHHPDCLNEASAQYKDALKQIKYDPKQRGEFYRDMLAALAAQG